MATNNVMLDPKLLLTTHQPKKEDEPVDPTFGNMVRLGLLREAMKKKVGDIGWEDTTKPIPNTGYKNFDLNNDAKVNISDLKIHSPQISAQLNKIEQGLGKKEGEPEWEKIEKEVPIPGTGYKNLDKNRDDKITIEDLKRFAYSRSFRDSAVRNMLNKIEQALNKKAGDTGWEDVVNLVRKIKWLRQGWWRRRLVPIEDVVREVVKEGYKQADINRDGIVDQKDIFTLWQKYRMPYANLIKEAYGKTSSDTGWNDKTQLQTQPGYKEVDFNKDKKIDQEDIFTLWANNNLSNLNLLKEAFGKTSNDPNWEDKREIITLGYKNADLNLDDKVDSLDLKLLFSALIPDGTLVRSEADNRFMIVSGTKKRIPDEKTFDNLGLDKSQIITLADEELELIPDGEEILLIKYDNGTLLKADNDYYLMAYGLRRKIPDEPTLKNLDLDESKAIPVSTSELENIPKGDEIPHFEYPIGTILKNSETNDEQYYLITPAGEKKLIPNKQTLENLGLDISKVKPVPFSKLQGISDDPERFPHLEYPNGTILRGADDKLYMTSLDNKIEIPDKTTWEALGLNIKEQTITVRAKGKEDGGSFPLIQLRIDGEIIKEWFVTDEYKDYTVTVPLSDGKHKIDIVYPNDQDIYTWLDHWVHKIKHLFKTNYYHHYESRHGVSADRELYVDYIQIGDKRIESDDPMVKYDQGANQKPSTYFDNVSVIPGQEKMVLPGALRLELNIENTVNVSSEQLKDLSTLATLPKVKYPNGTLLQNEDGHRYLMEGGLRRLIPNQITFEALGFNQQEIKTISNSELQSIDEGEPISKIKYSNGELIKGSDGQVYYMIGGIKKPIVDTPALHRIVKEKTDLIEVSTRWEADSKYWKYWRIEPWMREGIDYKKEYIRDDRMSIGGRYVYYQAITDYYMIEDGKRKSINASDVPNGTIQAITRWEADSKYWKYWRIEPWMREGIDYKKEYIRDDRMSIGGRYVYYQAITDYYMIEDGKRKSINASDVPNGTIQAITRWEADSKYWKYWRIEPWMREGIDYKKEYIRDDRMSIGGRYVYYQAITDYYVIENGRRRPINESEIPVISAQRFIKNVPDGDINSIPTGTPIKSPYLVKGSGNAVYLVSNGQKKYVPGGAFTFESYGLDISKVKTLSDEELANIPGDEGLPRVEYSEVYKQSKSWVKSVLSFGISLIPGIGQYYNLMCAVTGKDAITGAKLSKGSRFMSALNGIDAFTTPKIDQARKALDAAKKAKDIAKIGELTQKLNNLQKLTKITNFMKITYLGSAAAFGKDIFGDRITGYNRFLSGLQTTKVGLGQIAARCNLNAAQLDYLVKVSGNIDKITDYYQKGVMITGKEKIFSGKEVSDEERFKIAGNLLGEHIKQAASKPGTNIAEAMGKGLA
ncbi:MAG: carbohydrate-binding domain-containing protein, partial [bacterium]